ncbi:MAG: GspMb/PilO family protein, partial [Gemmatimonadota bacterium]
GMEDSMKALTRRVAGLAPAVLKGQTRTEAEADLAAHLQVTAEHQHLSVTRVTPMPDSVVRADGTLHRVSLEASLTGDLHEILALVDTLSRDRVVITPTAIRITAADPGAVQSAPEALTTELTVTGWYLVTTGSK